jgi:hypothetical protein
MSDAIGPPSDSAAVVAEELAAWQAYRGRTGHPARARWAAALDAVQSDPDAHALWLERMWRLADG